MLIITGCSQESEDNPDEVTNIFDPGFPGSGGDGNISVRPLINFKACPNINDESCPAETSEDFGRTTLTWSVPNLYQTEEYVVVIFRIEKEGPFDSEETLLSLESPQNNLGVVPFEIARVKDEIYVDTDIREGTNYYYFGFVVIEGFLEPTPLTGEQVEGFWSSASKLDVLTPTDGIGIGAPSPQRFWEKVTGNFGNSTVDNSGIANIRTIDPGDSLFNFPKGRIKSDENGTMLFIADTDNNRVVIWENANLRLCLQQLLSSEEAEDPEIRDLYIYSCYLQNAGAGAPLSAYNILGQPSQFSTLSCEEHNNECLTYLTEESCLGDHDLGFGEYPSFCQWNDSLNKCNVEGSKCLTQPTDILVDGDKLLISDTGNDRVVLHESILFSPNETSGEENQRIIGCDPEIIPGIITPSKCKANKFFGKKTFNDFTKYTLSAGEASLNRPTGLFVDGEDLYIADTLNNRIVKVSRFYGSLEGDGSDINEYYDCNDSSWLTAQCRWSGVLGQENYTQVKSLESLHAEDPDILTGTFYNILEDKNLLKRYFRYPTEMKAISKENGDILFLVNSNEDFETTSDLGTKVALKGRILVFDGIPLRGVSPTCTTLTFPDGGCNAVDVIGQESFDKLVILSGSAGGAGDYRNIVYGLENVSQMTTDNQKLYAVDSINNYVYVWNDITNKTVAGFPYSFKIDNPEGVYNNDINRNLPDLESLTGIQFSPAANKFYVLDGEKGTFYVLDFLDINF